VNPIPFSGPLPSTTFRTEIVISWEPGEKKRGFMDRGAIEKREVVKIKD